MYTFVTGGFRSGRSSYALRRAAELGPPPWLYVTAGEETDESIRTRLERQRRDKEAIWRTTVMPADLRTLFTPATLDGLGALVIDGLYPWLAARLAASPPATDSQLLLEVEEVADKLYRSPVPALIVSQEMGMGMPPSTGKEQQFLRLISTANHILTGSAGTVVMMVSGVPMRAR